MKAERGASARAPIEPFVRRDGRLFLEEVALQEIADGLEGHAARLISRVALERALGDEPRTLALEAFEDLECLRIAAAAGCWCRIYSRHELQLASRAGLAPERLVISGAVVDDGFLMESLLAGVACFALGDAERENLARIATLLELPTPGAVAFPTDAAPDAFDAVGGFLAGVLRAPPALALDLAWPLGARSGRAEGRGQREGAGASSEAAAHELQVLALSVSAEDADAAGESTSVAFLARGASDPAACPARLHGALARGDWAAVPSAAAVRRCNIDPVHEAPLAVLVSESSWRILGARELPPREED